MKYINTLYSVDIFLINKIEIIKTGYIRLKINKIKI